MRVNRHILPIIALLTISVAVRFVPLLYSTLPFNIDGFPLVRISEDIIETGHWQISYPENTSAFVTYNSKLPVISLLISTFALVFGRTPLEIAQVIMPLISCCAIVIIYAAAYKITKNELVSFFAGLALALNGFYVYLGAAVMKETVGLVLLILCLYLYLNREDPRKRILAGMLLLLIALTHHLTTWIAFIMVTLFVLTSNALQWQDGTFQKKRLIIDILSGPFLFVFVILYYESVKLSFFNQVSSINDVALFASVFLLGMLICISFSIPKKRKKPRNIIFNKPLIIPVVGLAFIVLNHYKTVFPGTIRTSTPFLIYLIPYLLLCSIALIGINVVGAKKTEHKPFIAAIIVAPFLVILFAFLKGFDAFTFILIYRSYDYIDFGLAICAGIGAGYLIKTIVKILIRKDNTSKTSFGLKATLSIVFLAICLSTVPLAYQGQEFYGVQDATYSYEFTAMNWLSENGAESHVSTDERLNDIMAPYFDLECDKTLPWKLKYSRSLERGSMLFMEEKWLREGAQMSPMEPILISKDTFNNTLERNNVIYNTGGTESDVHIVIVR
ncbi:MAG: hypothetical protein JSV56_12905 [Methanomassiliicoccales archaeon]|nr:MAG: hypothetical protein JSV56_12905 [Methanomassiliicoccales archaeon]